MFRRLPILVVVVTGMLLAQADQAQTPREKGKDAAGKESDSQRFVGAWRIAKWRVAGVEDWPAELYTVARVTFKDGSFILSVTEEPPLELGYELVCPGRIDLTAGITTKRSHGIYKFDGDDRLTLCFKLEDDGEFPTQFTAEKSDDQYLQVLVRAKPGEEKPTAAEIAKFKAAADKARK